MEFIQGKNMDCVKKVKIGTTVKNEYMLATKLCEMIIIGNSIKEHKFDKSY